MMWLGWGADVSQSLSRRVWHRARRHALSSMAHSCGVLSWSQDFTAARKRVEEASEGAAEAEARRRAMQAELRELAATIEVRSEPTRRSSDCAI